MTTNETPRRKAHSPFDPAAADRLHRMGLLDETGEPDRRAVSVLCRVFAGQLFDELLDVCRDDGEVRAVVTALIRATEQADPKRRFLAICLQYDAIYRPLPDPVWWLSGDPRLADAWSAGFLDSLRALLEGGGYDAEGQGIPASGRA